MRVEAATNEQRTAIKHEVALRTALESVYAAWRLYGEDHPSVKTALGVAAACTQSREVPVSLGIGPDGWISSEGESSPSQSQQLAHELHHRSIVAIRIGQGCDSNDVVSLIRSLDGASGSSSSLSQRVSAATHGRISLVPLSAGAFTFGDGLSDGKGSGGAWTEAIQKLMRCDEGVPDVLTALGKMVSETAANSAHEPDLDAAVHGLGAAIGNAGASDRASIGRGLGRWISSIPEEHRLLLLKTAAKSGDDGLALGAAIADAVPMEQLVSTLTNTSHDPSCRQTILLLTKLSRLGGGAPPGLGSGLAPMDQTEGKENGLALSMNELLQQHGESEHTPEMYRQMLAFAAGDEEADALNARSFDESEYRMRVGEIAAYLVAQSPREPEESPIVSTFFERARLIAEKGSAEQTLDAIERMLEENGTCNGTNERTIIEIIIALSGHLSADHQHRVSVILQRFGESSLATIGSRLASMAQRPDAESLARECMSDAAARVLATLPAERASLILSDPPWTFETAAAVLGRTGETTRHAVISVMLHADRRETRVLSLRLLDRFTARWDAALFEAASQLSSDQIVRDIIVRRLVPDLGLLTVCRLLDERSSGLSGRDAAQGSLLAEALQTHTSDRDVRRSLRAWSYSPGRLMSVFGFHKAPHA